MEYSEITVAQVAEYSGRPVESYTSYATTAIRQAILLFRMGTCLLTLPTDPLELELAEFAIWELADALVLSQPHKEFLASPVAGETIGSYSYSKITKAVQTQVPTGLSMFDLAVQRIGTCNATFGDVGNGGISMFEYDDQVQFPDDPNTTFLGPADRNRTTYIRGEF